jgi:hypothetical protein
MIDMKRVETKLTLTNLTTKKDYSITLPVGEEELTKFIDTVSNNDKDDYIISDGFNEIKFFWFDVMKYDNINELNKFVKHLNECDEYEYDLIMSLIDWGEISSLKDVYEVNLDDYKLEYDLHSYEDVGKYFYGLYKAGANDSTDEAVRSKKLIPGGCIYYETNPKYKCNSCSYEWGNYVH